MRVIFENGTSAHVECDVDTKTIEALKVLSDVVQKAYQNGFESGYDMGKEDSLIIDEPEPKN